MLCATVKLQYVHLCNVHGCSPSLTWFGLTLLPVCMLKEKSHHCTQTAQTHTHKHTHTHTQTRSSPWCKHKHKHTHTHSSSWPAYTTLSFFQTRRLQQNKSQSQSHTQTLTLKAHTAAISRSIYLLIQRDRGIFVELPPIMMSLLTPRLLGQTRTFSTSTISSLPATFMNEPQDSGTELSALWQPRSHQLQEMTVSGS